MYSWAKSTFVVLCAMLLIGGCAKTPDSTPPLMLRQLARSYLIGITYDQALIASGQDDPRKLHDKLDQLDELNATDISANLQLTHAEDQVRAGETLDIQSQQIKDKNPALSRQLQGQAAQKYRAALRWSPQFPSSDPLLLNALGYFLADRGSTPQDFELAAQLTGRSVELLGKTIVANNSLGVSNQQMLLQIQQQQALTRDSYAWALYKLKRFDDAENAQNEALAQAKSSALKDRKALEELQLHQAKILQAQGKTDEANAAMKESQRLQTDTQR